ncbi:MAG: hypothetical protein CO094_09475 [Anaerolineae bacterium CG_4_9_14_3_um_filter_57_17]|nr:hypothetical protein [bacterium]NCT21153.1 hypothetical protein [bacterium]OIO86852.1 MAG: hypothetical protein AUK01_01840 [Anaerolineae bacterium CG2_30_57_67]PJB65661.1 MAG: hypothetical protein CO094_09475 [Anaerolineae bacterium CG_4_9_14_3_um_filter_57_17]
MEEKTPFWERPAVRTLIIFVAMVVAYLVLGMWVDAGITTKTAEQIDADRILSSLFDAFFCIVGVGLWAVFFSQFILPVRKIKQRAEIFDRFTTYITGGHGPAIFVENGNIRASAGETSRKGPGLMWLDSASAALLRRPTNYTRTIGPGVHFTKKDEYIAATTALFPSILTFGPGEGEDPFKIAKDDPKYDEVQRHHWETRALTRDAIEVGASIAVIFRIRAEASEADKQRGDGCIGASRFGFDETNTGSYIRECISKDAKIDQPVWSTLPAQMAVDVWREYLSRFRLEQLFEIKEEKADGSVITYLQFISEMVKKRLTEASVPRLNDFGEASAETLPSPEFKRLSEMGVKVVNVNFKRLIFKPEVEEKFISQWTTLWMKNAQKEREFIEKARRLQVEKGRMDALVNFANLAGKDFSKFTPRNKDEALYFLVNATTREVISKYISQIGKTGVDTLTDMKRWLQDKTQ